MLFAPLEGWRRVEVTERRTKVLGGVNQEWWTRTQARRAGDGQPEHDVPGSLYEAFEPAEARRIAERLEIHYTPKHGSWLNMAEIEIGVSSAWRRIPDRDFLRNEVKAWQNCRNREAVAVDWRFTTDDARIKLKSLYPSIQRG